MKQTILAMLLAVLAACSYLPVREIGAGDDDPDDAGGTSIPEPAGAATGATASGELLRQSQASQAAGQYDKAASDIERAIRIEPRNPYLWLELARIQLATGNQRQASALAQKALTMADNDARARRAAERLLDDLAALQPR